MINVESRDLATPFLIGGLILMLAYCGAYYWQLSQPVVCTANDIVGTWVMNDDPTIIYVFNADGSLYDTGVYAGTWQYNGRNDFSAIMYNQGPYDLFIKNGLLYTGSAWTFHKTS